MRLLAWLLIPLLALAALIGPGRDLTATSLWWLTNSQPPELALPGPSSSVRGTLEVPVEARPNGRVDVVGADVDGREVPPGSALQIDTTGLPDGEHVLTVRAQDRSLRHNPASATLRFSSDNTPPSFDIQLSPASPEQAHTVVVQIYPSEPSDVQASLGDSPLHLFAAGSNYWAVLGVDSDEPPGQHQVVVQGRDRAGNGGHGEARLTIAPHTFTRDRVQVPDSLVPLLASSVRASEDEHLAPMYQRDNGPPLWKGIFLLPVLGPISTEFGEVRSYNGGPFQGHHLGTDFEAGQGAPVQAPARGRVVARDELRLRGHILILDHGGGVYSTYAHLSEYLVDVGQEVQAGQPIARVGSTGLSTGPHLHWEIWVNGKAVDPVEWTQREIP